MSKQGKLIKQILSGKADSKIKFNDLISLLSSLGFEVRVKGSHHIFRKEGVRELINIQKDGSNVKIYQVKQVRAILVEYRLTEDNYE